MFITLSWTPGGSKRFPSAGIKIRFTLFLMIIALSLETVSK